MELIEIKADVTREEFLNLSKKWETMNDVGIFIVNVIDYNEVKQLLDFAILTLPSSFSFGVMGSIAEIAIVPDEVLMKIFDLGDDACKESVCIRGDKSNALLAYCKNYISIHQTK
jgi:hypothetical protein